MTTKIKTTTRAILLVSILLISSVTFAQSRGGQKGPRIPDDEQIEKMVSALSNKVLLSPEQEKNISTLYTDHFNQVKEKTSGNSRPDRDEMEALKTELEEKVKAQLSEEQIPLYETLLKEQQEQKPQRQGQRRR